jgi:hypothetical protein
MIREPGFRHLLSFLLSCLNGQRIQHGCSRVAPQESLISRRRSWYCSRPMQPVVCSEQSACGDCSGVAEIDSSTSVFTTVRNRGVHHDLVARQRDAHCRAGAGRWRRATRTPHIFGPRWLAADDLEPPLVPSVPPPLASAPVARHTGFEGCLHLPVASPQSVNMSHRGRRRPPASIGSSMAWPSRWAVTGAPLLPFPRVGTSVTLG